MIAIVEDSVIFGSFRSYSPLVVKFDAGSNHGTDRGSQELHEKNNVVKKFRVTDSTGADNVVEVYNPSELRSGQTFGVSDGAEWFTIEILEVEKGSEYDDTCISGIWFDFS